MKTLFNSILVANRGEIAGRIMCSAKELGLRTIAVHSEADADAFHVRFADDAVCIGPAPVGESYLVIDKIIQAAKLTEAQAIHPGYGFLSENAQFAQACADAGIVFIGPQPDAIDLMGDKAKSKRRMIKAGVPCVPGYQGEKQDDETLLAEAKTIGFPLMVKAAAGGGGRGMRLVEDANNLPDAIKDARSEALNAFGSDVLILERAVQRPRHVEVQVFADQYGHTIHLGERDCSVQRRHQKVLEEAPCPIMTPELRKRMGAAAVKAAKDIGYVGAGTVEFMLDASGEFYFLEMNTRLQVEHPVTELITGLDLVALQIRVAQGEELGLVQDDVKLTGHAIEARLYAEDPAAEFLPATGPIRMWRPAMGTGVRIDAGIASGDEVSPFYDPMIAKIMAYGETREQARRRLIRALQETVLMGVKTNRRFLIDALSKDDFIQGAATTAFIAENFDPADMQGEGLSLRDASLAAVLQYETGRDRSLTAAMPVEANLLNWSSATAISPPFIYDSSKDEMTLHVTPDSAHSYTVSCGDLTCRIVVESRTENDAVCIVDDRRISVSFLPLEEARICVSIDGRDYELTNKAAVIESAAVKAGGGTVLAPMHGALLEVFVSEGDEVTRGQRLAILEAMKMQHEILADVDGTVKAVNVEAGNQIAADTLMIKIEEAED